MRKIARLFILLVMGLIVLAVIYPFFHELGHLLAAKITGAEIVEMFFFIRPGLLCNVEQLDSVEIVFIGLSGNIFPVAVSTFLELKNFKNWYMLAILHWGCLVSLSISGITSIFYMNGISLGQDDILVVMQCVPEYTMILLFVILVLVGVEVYFLSRSNIIVRCMNYIQE